MTQKPRKKDLMPTESRDPLLVERERTHGAFVKVARISQRLKEVFYSERTDLSPRHREALDMIASKIARILAGDPNFRDHWRDGAGYFTLGEESCEEKH